MKKAEIGEVLPNGNIYLKIEGFDTIQIIASNRIFTAHILAELITNEINKLSVCEKCGKLSITNEKLCYECFQLSDGGRFNITPNK
jgi:hypothetical protein